MKLTQYDRVLDHLARNKKLSQKQAINLYGCYRLSAVIPIKKRRLQYQFDIQVRQEQVWRYCELG